MRSETKTIRQCKIDTILSCVAAWEESSRQGAPSHSPADCAAFIRSQSGELQIDFSTRDEAVAALRTQFAADPELAKYAATVADAL